MHSKSATAGILRWASVDQVASAIIAFLLSMGSIAIAADPMPKADVPDDARQKSAAVKIGEVYKPDYAKAITSSQKVELANKMLKDARETDDDPVSRYVLLRIARDISVQQADLGTAFSVIQQMASDYDIDDLRLRLDAATAVVEQLKTAKGNLECLALLSPLVDEALSLDRYELARDYVKLALTCAKGGRDGASIKSLTRRAQEVNAMAIEFQKLGPHLDLLSTKSTDPKANVEAGRFYCFWKGDWERGIPMLALGEDADLKRLALMELEEPIDHEKLADAWWDLAEMLSDPVKATVREHAVASYLKVLPMLTGLKKRMVEQRLEAGQASVGRTSASKASAPAAPPVPKSFAGRMIPANRASLLKERGGSAESENAVGKALGWLARHQVPDGGWNFDHRVGPCQGQCDHHGSLENARAGATGLALLPFLGAGQTHRGGDHKDVVKRGLAFLVQNMKNNKQGGGDLADGGSMYSHGICAIALAEAYAMTRDKDLMLPAQMAVNHIIYAQDPTGGGWRYSPRQPGDTSVLGWQVMALRSAQLADLKVPQGTLAGASKFLDSVQMERGAKYGYTGPGPAAGTTAVGLLSRINLGWEKDGAALQQGVAYLSQTGPSKGNMYYNYYATQIMSHWGGDEWDKWNKGMRDFLINEQSKQGHQEGSWFMDGGDHGAGVGGRIYCTSIAAMILEAYYRHPPIYGTEK